MEYYDEVVEIKNKQNPSGPNIKDSARSMEIPAHSNVEKLEVLLRYSNIYLGMYNIYNGLPITGTPNK